MFVLSSTAFQPDAAIPVRFTCDGPDLSPVLAWEGAPAGPKAFALIVDDPDAPDPAAPTRIWLHWLIYNLPAGAAPLVEGAGNHPPKAGIEAVTDANRRGYHGPCPPIGRHRYYFRLFALDAMLPDLGASAVRADLERAMRGHVLGTATLMGTYQRP